MKTFFFLTLVSSQKSDVTSNPFQEWIITSRPTFEHRVGVFRWRLRDKWRVELLYDFFLWISTSEKRGGAFSMVKKIPRKNPPLTLPFNLPSKTLTPKILWNVHNHQWLVKNRQSNAQISDMQEKFQSSASSALWNSNLIFSKYNGRRNSFFSFVR